MDSDDESEPTNNGLNDVSEGNSNKLDSFDGEAFDAASIINLNSGKLIDVLADKDSVSMSPKNTSVLPLAPANESSTQERVLTDEDWTDGCVLVIHSAI